MKEGDNLIVRDGKGGQIQATLLKVWRREGKETHLTIRQEQNTSGGGAFTFTMGARAIFAAAPQATRVMLISTRAPLILYLFEVAHLWFDVTGVRAEIARA